MTNPSTSAITSTIGLLAAALLAGLLAAPRAALAQCVGDCSEDLRVTIDELVRGTTLALGAAPIAECPPADRDRDGDVAIDELVAAVDNSLHGCSQATPTISEASPTPTPTATATATPAAGPVVTFFGALLADNSLIDPVEHTAENVPIYALPFGSGFVLVVEARQGLSGESPGLSTFEPEGAPFLQIASSRALGNGSAAVCDTELPNIGGVPALDPAVFEDPKTLRTTVNDLSCRFIDGLGDREARFCGDGCVRFETGELGCQSDASHQYCAVVDVPLAFPPGDTLLTARVLDRNGIPGDPRRMIVRVRFP